MDQRYPACRTLPLDAYVAPSEYQACQESGCALTDASAWGANSVASLRRPSTLSGSRTSSFFPPRGPESFILRHFWHTQRPRGSNPYSLPQSHLQPMTAAWDGMVKWMSENLSMERG